jgi:hypothetical protein
MATWKPDPDFNRLRKAVRRQGEPDRVPLHDSVDVVLKRPHRGVAIRTPGASPPATGRARAARARR